MSIMNACYAVGFNGGTYPCAPVPGVPKYVAKWEGKLTVADLLQGDAFCEAKLIADSKKGKKNASKLVLFPLVREVTLKKEANTEVKYADGYTETTREGIPAYEFKVKDVDLYLASQLRKGNNVKTRYAIIDDKKQFLATFNSDGEVIGRSGKFFVDGVDVHGYDKGQGETMINLQADDPSETYDTAAVINLSAMPSFLFKSLRDVQLFEKAAATPIVGAPATRTITITNQGALPTSPTRTVTITAIGANGDTIDLLDIPAGDGGVSICGGPVAKTSSETTAAQLATKVAAACTGGYTATASGAVITITAPMNFGDSLNAYDSAPVVVGGITANHTAWTGGVDGDKITITADGIQLTINPVQTTQGITTPTLLATSIANEINTKTGDTGYSASSTGPVVTITTPTSVGGSLNGLTTGVTTSGTMTATNTAWVGGVTAGTLLHISGRTPSPLATVDLDFYSDFSSSVLGTDKTLWNAKKTDGTAKVVTNVAPNAAGYFDVSTNITTAGTYLIGAAEPEVLDAALIKGIELNSFVYTKS